MKNKKLISYIIITDVPLHNLNNINKNVNFKQNNKN